ncbi:MAG: hypothetical protein IT181_07205 [Acidobacteria bacterium]|nr:hypothetical protein [Acidobacteriota bacterium]
MRPRVMLTALAALVVPAVLAAQHVHPTPAPAAAPASARAQEAPPDTLPPAVITTAPPLSAETPVQCWWRSSSGAIRIGEIVDVVLTCAVLESATVTAVPDESRLTVASVQLTPFEIVDGAHPPDVRQGDRRFIQYRYRLRIINPDAIGRDVKTPPLAIPYRLQSRVGGTATLAGRDLAHQMPQLIFRVVSQVPADADDIRDSADASFAEIEALRFRANAFNVAAMVLTALGAATALSLLAPAFGLLRTKRRSLAHRMSDRLVLSHAAGVLGDRLDGARGGGWTPEALAEAHTAARVVAAMATGLGARELSLGAAAVMPEGRLVVRRRFRRQAAAVTAHVTTAMVAKAMAALPPDASAATRSRLEQLRDVLTALTRAQYGAEGAFDATAVDEAVTSARDIGAAMAREQLTSPRAWFRRPAAPVTPTPEF